MNHLFTEPQCVHKKSWNTCGECRPTLRPTPNDSFIEETMKQSLIKQIEERVEKMKLPPLHICGVDEEGISNCKSLCSFNTRMNEQIDDILTALETLKSKLKDY